MKERPLPNFRNRYVAVQTFRLLGRMYDYLVYETNNFDVISVPGVERITSKLQVIIEV
jgi:hypothetical protein